MDLDSWGAHVGEEARKNFGIWLHDGFYEKYLSGPNVLDIGFQGYLDDVKPITPSAIGVGLNYPGYDGKTLPFPEGSQDTVFVSHCLEHIDDYRSVIADWFRVLKVGGYLVIAVPHQYLYERRLTLPSQFNLDHRRFYTPASLLREVEESIDPLGYRVRMLTDNDQGFDYAIEPKKHATGSYEILLVLEKIARPDYADAVNEPPPIRQVSQGVFTPMPRPDATSPVEAISATRAPGSVIAFKMDHLGDFILAMPALLNLRRAFPAAHLTLVCGEWNVSAARDLGVFDEVIGFSLFERNAALNGVTPLAERLQALATLLAGRDFDLAIDLRVDDDTRPALKQVTARQRAGIGRTRDYPYLDIALPLVSPTVSGRAHRAFFNASLFNAVSGVNNGHEIEVPGGTYARGTNLIWGPYRPLLPSRYCVRLLIEDEERRIPPLDYDIVCEGGSHKLAAGRCEDIAADGGWLIVDERVDDVEIRLWARGEACRPFTFRGCMMSKSGDMEGPHQTEMMAMLVALVEQRARFSPVRERVG